jgi:membrane protein implicated in regulation of membrane protease activity
LLFVGAVFLALFVLPSPWGLIAVVAAGFIEVGETMFWIRFSRRRRIRMGAETLIGASAEVAAPCRPRGQVRVQGELWQAVCEEGADAGEAVCVVGRDGLTLLVERQ